MQITSISTPRYKEKKKNRRGFVYNPESKKEKRALKPQIQTGAQEVSAAFSFVGVTNTRTYAHAQIRLLHHSRQGVWTKKSTKRLHGTTVGNAAAALVGNSRGCVRGSS
jgi:hypothetical protein